MHFRLLPSLRGEKGGKMAQERTLKATVDELIKLVGQSIDLTKEGFENVNSMFEALEEKLDMKFEDVASKDDIRNLNKRLEDVQKELKRLVRQEYDR